MALIKAIEIHTGEMPGYWSIAQVNQSAARKDWVVDLAGYIDENKRRAGKSPVTSVQFVFTPEDHPISEVDPDIVDEARLNDWQDYDWHISYVHIKAVCAAANSKPAEERTRNESTAILFDGAQDKYE